jgi:hypothetical protein
VTAELIPFFVALGIVLLYPALSVVAHYKLKKLKGRVAGERCPNCHEAFGATIVQTAHEIGADCLPKLQSRLELFR